MILTTASGTRSGARSGARSGTANRGRIPRPVPSRPDPIVVTAACGVSGYSSIHIVTAVDARDRNAWMAADAAIGGGC